MPGAATGDIGQIEILADEKQMLMAELKLLEGSMNADVASKQLLNTIMDSTDSDPLCSKSEKSPWTVEGSGCCVVN